MPDQKYSVLIHPLDPPSLEEVASVLQKGYEKNFESVAVSVVDCPDLTRAPFSLAAEGLCDRPLVADVGGVPNLVPSPQRHKLYDVQQVARDAGLTSGLLIGAGAGPLQELGGVNSELMCNVSVSTEHGTVNSTRVALVNPDGSASQKEVTTTGFSLMANLFVSEGHRGKVIEIIARRRTGEENFVTLMRKVLAEHYGQRCVAVGGAFVIEHGKGYLHVMPDFSGCPLNSSKEVDDWLKYYEYDAPLVGVGYLVSHDPGLDLRMEHFHCFSDHGVGGHYHYDTTPEEVVYRGYFNVAESIARIDRPEAQTNRS